ncbi:MAG: zinc-dependent peptidase [Gammaproteobacteria bacterium]|nr:zinc-dependent peptidase [Gammaproteobacteria bacterium]
MIFGVWKRRRQERYLRRNRPDESLWQVTLGQVRAASHLSREDRSRLRDLSMLLLREKSVEAAGGLELSGGMRLRIACEACVPILNLGLDLYRGWYSIVVYPGEFIARHEYADEAGVVHSTRDVLSGEAWEQGPVIIAWNEVAASDHDVSVIIHEMAHKLDLLDGCINGRPPLHAGMDAEAWSSAFSRAYASHVARVESGRETVIDPYAAEEPGEFFAVVSEAFFMIPQELSRIWPKVYDQLALYYRQQPAEAS